MYPNKSMCENQLTAAKPSSQMEMLMKQLQEQVGRLSGLRNQLHERLEVVMSPGVVRSSTDRPPCQGGIFPLGADIMAQANELEEIGDSLEDILGRMGI